MKKGYLKKVKIPDSPGVYFFIKKGEILYIGKATSLKDRVRSYFSEDLIESRGPLIVDLVFRADKISWEKTDSVLEALIKEAELIKKYQPKYNTKEKSDKSFNYVCITREKPERVIIKRGRGLETKKYEKTYGPFTNGSQLKEAMKIIRRIFPYFDEYSSKKQNTAFYKQLGLIPGAESTEDNIKNLKLFFEGKKKKILLNLKKQMLIYAKEKKFERAGEIKKQIFALKHINDIALLKENPSFLLQEKISSDSPRNSPAGEFLCPSPSLLPRVHSRTSSPSALFRIEAYDVAHMAGKNMVGVMVVLEDGEPSKNEYRKFKIRTQTGSNDTGALKEILLRRFSHKEWNYPSIIVLDGGSAQLHTALRVLKGIDTNIYAVSVVKDERHRPKGILGNKKIIQRYKKEIFLSNSEAHRFSISYHKKTRSKNFLK